MRARQGERPLIIGTDLGRFARNMALLEFCPQRGFSQAVAPRCRRVAANPRTSAGGSAL